MKSAIIAATIASAAAFAPAPVAKTTSSLNAFESELGAQAPLGFFDPLGMLDDADQDRFDRLRYVEIKHGRIAQLAFLGQIATRNGQHWDGAIDKAGDLYSSYPNGLAAILGPDAIPAKGVLQIILAIGVMEVTIMSDWTEKGGKYICFEQLQYFAHDIFFSLYHISYLMYLLIEFPGDLRNGTFKSPWGEDGLRKKRAVELNNGRAAMMGILGKSFIHIDHEMCTEKLCHICTLCIYLYLTYP